MVLESDRHYARAPAYPLPSSGVPTLRPWPYSPAGVFDLLDGETVVGTLSHSVFALPDADPYDGIVREEGGALVLRARISVRIGVIDGLALRLDDGTVYRMRPHPLPAPRPGMVARIEDADAFRVALALLEASEDAGDESAAQALRRRIDLAPFYRCPCCEGAALVDECVTCDGDGFVWEGVAP